MNLRPFTLERYFAKHEFSARYLLCASDCEKLLLPELLELAPPDLLARWERLSLGYVETIGSPFLREEIAGTYAGVDPSQVLSMVPSEAIYAALRSMLAPGDRVVCTWPGYQSLYGIPEAIGCAVDRWMPQDRSRGWRFVVEELEALLRDDTKLIVINFPHNPTGATLSESAFRRVLDLARSRGIRVFSDEMYRAEGIGFGPCLPSACELYDKAVTLSGMSKVYGLGGIRQGWLVIKDEELYRNIWSYRDYLSNGGNAMGEVLAAIALRARKTILDEQGLRIARNIDAWHDFMGRYGERFGGHLPVAGHVFLVKMLDGTGAEAFCDKVVAESGIMLLPSTVYGMEDRYFRIGLGREDFPEGLWLLERHLRLHG
jgi:aspartate/methionine/tyrosine aminotransferase